MKRWKILLSAMLLMLSLAACGGSEGETPSAVIGDISSGEAGQSAERPDPGDADNPAAAEDAATVSKVEIKGDTVLYSDSDGMGTKTVTEYRYRDGALKEMVFSYEYPDEDTAGSVLKEMENGSLRQTADASYVEFRQDGSKIVCTASEGMTAAFSGMSKEELAAFLAGEQSAASPFGGETDSGETTIHTTWEALSLPDGFPRLSDGVTTYAEADDCNFFMEWDDLSEEEAQEMAAKLEKWAGANAEVYADENGANWSILSETRSVTLTYYADTFDGAMPQVMLSVGIWQ